MRNISELCMNLDSGSGGCDIDYCDIYRLSNYRRRRFQRNVTYIIPVM